MIPFWGESACPATCFQEWHHHLDPTPYPPPSPGASPQKGPGTSHCPSLVPREPPPPVSFSSRCKDCSEGALSQKQKCLYVGVCLRNNWLLFIKTPFILFAGMCFLGSRGWDAQWSPVRDATAAFQACGRVGEGCGARSVQGPQDALHQRPQLCLPQAGMHFVSRAVLSAKYLSLWLSVCRRFYFSQNLRIEI